MVSPPRRPPIVFLMGPTASGKTGVAIALSQRLPLDIISVDSTLLYRGLNIGSAKPTAEELALAPHQLIDIRDPAEVYSVADFVADAHAAIAASHARGRVPLLVGGTMMYFNALLHGLADMPAADPALRAELEERAAREGWPALHKQLAAVDPETASSLHPNHSQRIMRALEVYYLSGESMSTLRRRQPRRQLDQEFQLVQIALLPRHRSVLHQRIERRFLEMLNQGFEEEVRILHSRGDLSPGLPAIRAVGYRQMWDYLEGATGRDEMIARAVAATRQLAKRQLTWLRKWPKLEEVYIDSADGRELEISELTGEALNYLEGITI